MFVGLSGATKARNTRRLLDTVTSKYIYFLLAIFDRTENQNQNKVNTDYPTTIIMYLKISYVYLYCKRITRIRTGKMAVTKNATIKMKLANQYR